MSAEDDFDELDDFGDDDDSGGGYDSLDDFGAFGGDDDSGGDDEGDDDGLEGGIFEDAEDEVIDTDEVESFGDDDDDFPDSEDDFMQDDGSADTSDSSEKSRFSPMALFGMLGVIGGLFYKADRPLWLQGILTGAQGAIVGGIALAVLWVSPAVDHEPGMVKNDMEQEVEETIEKIPVELPPGEPPPSPRYYVQIADCLNRQCLEDNQLFLARHGHQPNVVQVRESISMTEIVTTETFSDFRAQQWVDAINRNYPLMGQAYRKKLHRKSQRYQVSMGSFPSETTAHHVLTNLNYRYAGELQFKTRRTRYQVPHHDIRLGNYEMRQDAVDLKQRLIQQNSYFVRVQVKQL